MGRSPCCDKANVKRGPWSPEEDATLKNYVERYGTGGNWIALPQKAGTRSSSPSTIMTLSLSAFEIFACCRFVCSAFFFFPSLNLSLSPLPLSAHSPLWSFLLVCRSFIPFLSSLLPHA